MQKVSGFCLNIRKNCKKKGKKFGADISASVTERVKNNRNQVYGKIYLCRSYLKDKAKLPRLLEEYHGDIPRG